MGKRLIQQDIDRYLIGDVNSRGNIYNLKWINKAELLELELDTEVEQEEIKQLLNVQATSGEDYVTVEASEQLLAGQFVNIYTELETGKQLVRPAVAKEGCNASGFVKASYPKETLAKIYLEGKNVFLEGLMPGNRYYLNNNPMYSGKVTLVAPNNPGDIIQYLGLAISDKILDFEIQEYTIIE